MEKREYIKWIDGIRGGACLIVLCGHSLACIFPAMYFGNSYQAHHIVEYMFHASPFNILANASAMVTMFFLLGGFLLTTNFYKRRRTYFAVIVNRYIRYLPMVFLGIMFGYFVMFTGCVNSIQLGDLSYAKPYVAGYNNFMPTIWGKDGMVFEGFIKVFIVGSDYNAVLWFISVEFIGNLFCESLLRIVHNKKVQYFCFFCLFLICSVVGIWMWKLQYFGAMCLGCVAGIWYEERKCKHERLLFMLGFFILTIPQQNPTGIYKVFSYMQNMIVPLWGIGSLAMFEGIRNNQTLKKVFEAKLIQKLGKNSFGIYVIQWPVIISVSCGITLMLTSVLRYEIAGVIGVLVGCVVTVVIAMVIHKTWYKFIYKKLSLFAQKFNFL